MQRLNDVDWWFVAAVIVVALGFLAGASYLAACAGARRWLKIREWWGPWKRKEKPHGPD